MLIDRELIGRSVSSLLLMGALAVSVGGCSGRLGFFKPGNQGVQPDSGQPSSGSKVPGNPPGAAGGPGGVASGTVDDTEKENSPVEVAGVNLTTACVDPVLSGKAQHTALVECELRSDSTTARIVRVESTTLLGVREGERHNAFDFSGVRHPVAGFFTVSKSLGMRFYFEVPSADLPVLKQKPVRLEFGGMMVDFVRTDRVVNATAVIGNPAQLTQISTLTYDRNGGNPGSPVPNQEPVAGRQAVLVADAPGLVGPRVGGTLLIFSGWSTTLDGSGRIYAVGDPITIAVDTTLYAVWKEPVLIYVNDSNRDGDRFTTATGVDASNCGAPSQPCRTIQYALERFSPVLNGGVGVIAVDAGDYSGCIEIFASVELRGPNWDISPTSGTRRPEATVNPEGTDCDSDPSNNHISVKAANVTISGFSFKNSKPTLVKNPGLIMGGGFSNHLSLATNIRIEKNIFSGLNGGAIAVLQDCTGPCWTIVDNKIERIRPAINVFQDNYPNAIHVRGSGAWMISQNFITDISSANQGNADVSARGIFVVQQPSAGINSLEIRGNYIEQVDHSGVRVHLNHSSNAGNFVKFSGNAIHSANKKAIRDGTVGGLQLTANVWNNVEITGNYFIETSPALVSQVDLGNLGTKQFKVTENSFLSFIGAPIVHSGLGIFKAIRNWFGRGVPCEANLMVGAAPGSLEISDCLTSEP